MQRQRLKQRSNYIATQRSVPELFQMASDRALEKQRERFRYGLNGYESDQGFHTQDSGRSSEVAYSEQDHRLKLNKVLFLAKNSTLGLSFYFTLSLCPLSSTVN